MNPYGNIHDSKKEFKLKALDVSCDGKSYSGKIASADKLASGKNVVQSRVIQ